MRVGLIRIAVVAAVLLLAYGRMLADAPGGSWVIEGLTADSVKRVLGISPGPDVAGIWSATADGASLAIIPGEPPGAPRSFTRSCLIVVLRSPRPGVRPGTVMGWCSPAAKAGYYDCTMFTRCNGSQLSDPKRFTLRLNDSSRLSLIKIHDGLEIVVWKIIPYMFRSFLRERHDRPRDLDGFIRQWPVSGCGVPAAPRYL